jgi:galactose mutarotase-like enzyme
VPDAPQVGTGTFAGWDAVSAENGTLRVTVLPGRGAELVELVHLARGVDVLFHAPWGLGPPGSPPRPGSDGHAFLEGYAGGWQELFPSVNDPCEYRGRQVPFHGEVATRAWNVAAEATPDEAVLRCSVDCETVPVRLERTMRLAAGSSELVLEETVTSLADRPVHAVWGHHCVLGPPLVAPGARLRLPARTIVTIPELWEETARLEPGQRSAWPEARLRDGGTVDLSHVPGPEEGSHDDVYLTDLDAGWVEVENAGLGLAFRLHFDPRLFPWVISWQPYGGARAMPLAGSYALGVEPWTSRLCLADAVEAGEALELAPGETLTTTLRAIVTASCRG